MRGSGDHHSIGCCAEYQGNTPPFVGRQQPCRTEVAAGREQPGRFAQSMLQRRKPVGISLLAQPYESAQSLQFLIGRAVVGHMFVDGGRIAVDSPGLARREVANGRGKPWVGDEECAELIRVGTKPRGTLCSPCVPGSKRCKFLVDAVLDSLVVAGLEMQAVVVAAGAPSSGPNRASLPTKNMATAMGVEPIPPTLSISWSGMEAASSLKKSRFR